MSPVSLKIPTFEDYAHFYEKRFLDEVVYWADDSHYEISLNDYAYGRMLAQNEGEILERIIVVNGESVGTITARDYVERTCQCTLGIVIADPACWGHGYGYEAIKQFTTILATQGIGRVILETYANNKRALNCFHKIGFQKKRVFFAPNTGRFIVQMFLNLRPPKPIGEVIRPGDPRWKAPKH
ncbi:MAG: GNAT family N-acetyltransferase [Proteobacteria bacterium]|nr:GNAT family N-acetyltransferase [Pseudomonadota bacterium]